jgi:hypothetical protein
MICIAGRRPPEISSRSDKFLFPGPPITRSRLIPGPLSRVRERASALQCSACLLVWLVRAGLAAAEREVVMTGGKAIEVVRVRITAAGRRAIEE